MNKVIKLSALILTLAATTGAVFSQEKDDQHEKKESSEIIIHKKGSTNEKLNIVIDGDKVTINGKPVDDYKSDDVDIIRGGDEMDVLGQHGMAFGTPRPDINMLGDDFMQEIHSNKAFLGVMTKEGTGGAEVTDVTKESPAEKAGIKAGDIITKVNDDKIEDADDLYNSIGKYKPGEKVNITFKQNGKEVTKAVELSENKQVRAFSWKKGDDDQNTFNFRFDPRVAPRVYGWNGDMWNERPRLGVQVQDTEDGKGVKVLDVDDDEAAGKAGLKEDDVITQVNGKNVTSVDDIKDVMKDVKKGDTVKITFMREGKTQTVDVKFPKDLKTSDL